MLRIIYGFKFRHNKEKPKQPTILKSRFLKYKFYTFWRKAVRQIWKTPYNTHCDYLPHICDSLPIEEQIVKRFCKFLHQVMNNDNIVSILCGKLAFAGSASSVCNNINYISNLLKSKRHDLVFIHFNEIT